MGVSSGDGNSEGGSLKADWMASDGAGDSTIDSASSPHASSHWGGGAMLRLVAASLLLIGSTIAGCEAGTEDPKDRKGGTEGMIEIPGGPFWRGCNESLDSKCEKSEMPYRELDISTFEIDETPVTQSAYQACVDAGVCNPPTCPWEPEAWGPDEKPDHPAVCISWIEAREYCQWVGKRLPTEAEWEKAARGTDGRLYPWGNEEPTCDHANYGLCAGGQTTVVGAHPVGDSPYGVKDMAGNVLEYVEDSFSATYYEQAPSRDPTGPEVQPARVVRGGSANLHWVGLRTSARFHITPNFGDEGRGFRCARQAP